MVSVASYPAGSGGGAGYGVKAGYRGGSAFASLGSPFFTGVASALAMGATGDAEAGGVPEGGLFSFFGCFAEAGMGGDSPPAGWPWSDEYKSST